MGVLSILKRVFNTGELSPKVYGRTDIDRYNGGLKTMLNMVPIPQGGCTRRPGFEYVAAAKNNNAAIRLIPFQFSETQAYIISAQNGVFRFFRNGGAILGANNAIYEVAHTYTANELSQIQYSQSFDTLFITHNNHAPATLTRTAHNNWTLGTISFNNAPGEWSNNNGYPRTCTFYQDRMVYASSTFYPSRLWFSKTSEYNNFTTGTNDADGFSINLLSGRSDVIFWLASHRSIIAAADSGAWVISASNGSTTAISPTNRKASKDSYFGSAAAMPVMLGDIIIHAGYPASKMRELSYSYESDGYRSSELSVLADHLLEGYSVTELAYQQSPFEIVWCRRSDGTLLALTYMQEHKVVAWSRHTTSGNIQSVATISGNYETELWIAVDRTINNNAVTYIERMKPFYFNGFNNAFFVDSGLTGSVSGYNELTFGNNQLTFGNNAIVFESGSVGGFSHLANQQVSYLIDGNICGNATVASNGYVTTINNTGNIVMGLPYTSTVETLPLDVDLKSGSAMFHVKRVTSMGLRYRSSAGGSYGPDANNQTTLLRNNALQSGDFTNLSVRGGHNSARTVVLQQRDPLPFSIDAIGLDVEVE